MSYSTSQLNIETLRGTKLQDIWLLFLGSGIAMMILGGLSLIFCFTATMATMMVFGVVVIVGSVFQFTSAFWARAWRGFVLHLLLGLMYFIVGIFLLDHPIQAATGLTILVAASLMVAGLFRITFSIVDRFNGWPWGLLSGVVSLFLGISIWKQWPLSGLWVIGLFLGIELLMSGWSWVLLSLAARPVAPQNK